MFDQPQNFFFVRCNQKIERVLLNEITHIEGLTNYITIHTKEKKYITYLTLKTVERNSPQTFVRIHKSYLVPISKIVTITANEVELENVTLPISRNFKNEMMKKIDHLLFKR